MRWMKWPEPEVGLEYAVIFSAVYGVGAVVIRPDEMKQEVHGGRYLHPRAGRHQHCEPAWYHASGAVAIEYGLHRLKIKVVCKYIQAALFNSIMLWTILVAGALS